MRSVSHFGVGSNDTVENVKFENAKPAYVPPKQGNARWANDNGNSQADETAVLRNEDGSLGVVLSRNRRDYPIVVGGSNVDDGPSPGGAGQGCLGDPADDGLQRPP